MENEPNSQTPIIGKPATQAQLDLCRAALSIAACQCDLTATMTYGSCEIGVGVAQHFAKSAMAMRELAMLIEQGLIVGSKLIRTGMN